MRKKGVSSVQTVTAVTANVRKDIWINLQFLIYKQFLIVKSIKLQYDLEERTRKFSKRLLGFCKKLPVNINSENLIRQVLRSATSIGANYCEANGAISKPDFRLRINICKKEAKETDYWLDLLGEVVDQEKVRELKELTKENRQIMLIFCKISTSLKN